MRAGLSTSVMDTATEGKTGGFRPGVVIPNIFLVVEKCLPNVFLLTPGHNSGYLLDTDAALHYLQYFH